MCRRNLGSQALTVKWLSCMQAMRRTRPQRLLDSICIDHRLENVFDAQQITQTLDLGLHRELDLSRNHETLDSSQNVHRTARASRAARHQASTLFRSRHQGAHRIKNPIFKLVFDNPPVAQGSTGGSRRSRRGNVDIHFNLSGAVLVTAVERSADSKHTLIDRHLAVSFCVDGRAPLELATESGVDRPEELIDGDITAVVVCRSGRRWMRAREPGSSPSRRRYCLE